MQKREIQKRLANLLRENRSIDYILLLEHRGIPITSVSRGKEFRLNPEYFGSIINRLSAPGNLLQTAYNLSPHLATLSFFKEKIIFQLNLDTHIIALVIPVSFWPINLMDIQRRLNEFYYSITHGTNHKKSHLSIIYASMEKTEDEKIDSAREKISVIERVIDSFKSGEFGQYELQLPTSDPVEVVKVIGQAITQFTLRTVIVSPDNNILFMHPQDSEKMAYITVRSIQDMDQDFKNLKAGPLLINIHYYKDGEVFVSSPLGEIDGKRIEICNQLAGWNIGLNEILSYNYTAAANAFNYIGSDESRALMELINFLLSDLQTIQQSIEDLLNSGDRDKAIRLMERGAYLLEISGDLSTSGDFLKWIGYTYYEAGDMQKAVSYYKKASKYYEDSQDYENLAAVYTDIASIYENLKDESAAIAYFNNAYSIYSQLGNSEHADALSEKISDLYNELAKKIQEYVRKEPFESKHVSEIARAIGVSEEYLPDIMDLFISNDVLGGRLDKYSGLYYKYEQKSAATSPSYAASSRSQTISKVSVPGGSSRPASGGITGASGISYVPVDYSRASEIIQKLVQENHGLDREIKEMELKFADRGVKTIDFLRYQAKIQKRTFNNTKMSILQSRYEFNTSEGIPIRCPICLKEFSSDETFVTGPGGHGFHSKCISKWIKTQDKCPICEQKLLPALFESSGLTGQIQVQMGTDREELERLKSELELLKSSAGDSDLMQKLIVERENKARLMRELNQKERVIRELKSQLELYKRGRL